MEKKIETFCSYAPEDKELFRQLMMQLKRQVLIEIWSEADILPGEVWQNEVSKHLNTAQIILLLISPDFLDPDPDRPYYTLMQRAMRRQKEGVVHVVPVLLRPVDLQETPVEELRVYPTNGRPVTMWENRDRAFVNIAEGVRHIARKLLNLKEPEE